MHFVAPLQYWGPSSEVGVGMPTHYLVVPPEVLAALPPRTRRVVGSVNGVPYHLALHTDGADGIYLMMGKAIRTAARIQTGDAVHVELTPDPDPDAVHLPDELAVALAQDEVALTAWQQLTPGMQRSLCYYVNGAKGEDTRIRRALQLLEKVKTKDLYPQRKS